MVAVPPAPVLVTPHSSKMKLLLIHFFDKTAQIIIDIILITDRNRDD